VGVPIFVVGGVKADVVAPGKPATPAGAAPLPPPEMGVPEAEPTEEMTPPPVMGVSPV